MSRLRKAPRRRASWAMGTSLLWILSTETSRAAGSRLEARLEGLTEIFNGGPTPLFSRDAAGHAFIASERMFSSSRYRA